MPVMSKLQIRAKVLSVLSEIKSGNNFGVELILRSVSMLSDIEDKNTLLDVFFKEVIKMNDDEVACCACIVKELVHKDIVEEAIFDILKKSSLSDEAKYKLVQLLRIVGASRSINEIPQYFENPQELIDLETEKMLERASFNPETMLDFLDFIYAVSDRDKQLLLTSLKDDYTGDNLANLLYPVLYSDFTDDIKIKVIDILSESKSSLALKPLDYLLSVSENKEILSAVELALKKLKLSGASQEKADKFYSDIVKDFKPYEFYTTIPDGAGNQALLASVLNKENNINFVAVVINDLLGIVDCFGFYNISKDETNRVISKFYKSEGKYKVSDKYVKTRLLNAIQTTIENRLVFPYEFIAWYTLLFNLPHLESTIDDYIEKIKCDDKVEKDKIIDVLSNEYTYRWFISSSEKESLKEAIDKIYNLVELKEENFNQILVEYVDKIFDSAEENIWKNRLKQLIYLLNENDYKSEASKFLKLLKDDELFILFKQVIIQRSLFNNLLLLKENVKQSSLPINIFRKKMVNDEKYNIAKIEDIVFELKKSWLNE